MTTVRATIEMARSALLGGQAEAALAPCQAILERYPKHLEASCLIAEARREMRQLPEAADLFERVLAADPESLIGHWGLSTILEEQGDVAAALYELECAWDVSPGHRAVRDELMRLRGSVGAAGEPELASIGLARVYARGFQWRRAVAELQRALAGQPERLDARVLLAECLWHLGRLPEAADAAAEALVESPDCLKANLIRGYAQLGLGGRGVEEGRKLLGRALTVDPECALAPKLFPGRAMPPPLVEVELDLEADPPTLLAVEPAAAARAHSLRDLADGVAAAPAAAPVEAEGSGMRVIRPAPTSTTGRAGELLVGQGEVERPAAGVEPAAHRPVEVAPAPPAVRAEPAERGPAANEMEPPRSVEAAAAAPASRPARASAPAPEPVAEPAAVESASVEPVQRGRSVAEPVGREHPAAVELPAAETARVAEPEAVVEPEEVAEPAAALEPETVPTWMVRPAAAAPAGGVHGLDPTIYAEWADLLGESVELDHDAATRLEEALAEATGGHATSGAWREVVLSNDESLDGAPRSRGGRESRPAAAEPVPARAVAARPEAAPVAAGPLPSLEEQLAALSTLATMGQVEEVAEAYRGLLRQRADAAPAAIEALTVLIVSHPDSGALHRALGDAYMRSGRFQKAIEAYNRAVASQPQSVAAA